MTEGLESWVRGLAAAGLFTGAVLALAPGAGPGRSCDWSAPFCSWQCSSPLWVGWTTTPMQRN